jgi:hypothetical protein
MAVVCLTPARVLAQALPLPRLDTVNIFVQAGEFAPRADLVGTSHGALYGWGFETAFEAGPVGHNNRYMLELAVGYEQVSGIGSRVSQYQVDGALRDLPSVTAYLTDRDSGFYLGVKTGLVELSHFHAYDAGGAAYGMNGDTIMLGAAAGYTFRWGLDLELAYEVRWFPGITYDLPPGVMTVPSDLPKDMNLHGFMFAVAYQIGIHRREPSTPMPFADAKPVEPTKPLLISDGPAKIMSYYFQSRSGTGHAELYLVSERHSCTDAPLTDLGPVPGIQGEIVVPMERRLCARVDTAEHSGTLSWTGFGP